MEVVGVVEGGLSGQEPALEEEEVVEPKLHKNKIITIIVITTPLTLGEKKLN